jgi:hypothetical protein
MSHVELPRGSTLLSDVVSSSHPEVPEEISTPQLPRHDEAVSTGGHGTNSNKNHPPDSTLSALGSSEKTRINVTNFEVQSSAPTTLFSNWLWELLMWLLGTVALILIVTLLAYFNGKPLSHWKSAISLNAIIAILSQTTVSALLVSVSACISQLKWAWLRQTNEAGDVDTFDRASRGPQGCLGFLWKFHGAAYVQLFEL